MTVGLGVSVAGFFRFEEESGPLGGVVAMGVPRDANPRPVGFGTDGFSRR
jgi:hypothetical protein